LSRQGRPFWSKDKETTITLILPRQVGPGSAWPVQVGALWHSAWDAESVLQKFCKPIFGLTGDEQFPFCLVGSGAAIQIAGRHFVFCCRHQVSRYSPDKIAIPLSFDKKIMSATSTRVVRITDAVSMIGRLSCCQIYSRNNTALKTVKPQNKKGLTETMIFPSGDCFTLNFTSFCAVVSATVTYNSPMQVTSCAA
jgi:hypothetical protein